MKKQPALKERWTRFRQDPRTKKASRWLQRLIVFGILVLIVYQLMDIGWQEVLRSLPRNPLFYLLFLLIYLSLPVAELFIYRQVWPLRAVDGLSAFLTKKVYNHELIGYSGEFFLFLWGRKRVQKSDKEVFKNIRDNAILSSITSNLVAVVLLVMLLYTGRIDLSQILDDTGPIYIAAGVLVFIVVATVLYYFRRYLFALPPRKTVIVASIYLGRFLLHHLLILMMWAVAIPGTSWAFWFTFLALYIVVNRIPFLPSKDLVFMWAGIEFARAGDVTLASIAGMLLVFSALNKVMNLSIFTWLTYVARDSEMDQAIKKAR